MKLLFFIVFLLNAASMFAQTDSIKTDATEDIPHIFTEVIGGNAPSPTGYMGAGFNLSWKYFGGGFFLGWFNGKKYALELTAHLNPERVVNFGLTFSNTSSEKHGYVFTLDNIAYRYDASKASFLNYGVLMAFSPMKWRKNGIFSITLRGGYRDRISGYSLTVRDGYTRNMEIEEMMYDDLFSSKWFWNIGFRFGV